MTNKVILFIFVLFSSNYFSQNNGGPIPIWKATKPDSIYLSENNELLLMSEICQNYVIYDKYKAYKGFCLYKKSNLKFESTESFDIFGMSCDSIYYPKDIISKYQLTNYALKVDNNPSIKIISKVKKRKKLKEGQSDRFNYVFSLENNIYKNDSLIYSFSTRELSKTKKQLKPTAFDYSTFKSHDNQDEIIIIDVHETYIRDINTWVNSQYSISIFINSKLTH